MHLVGIGGAGMSGIAEVLVNLGHSVTGSDLKASAVTARLARLGAGVFNGHAARHVEGAHVVVTSSAVRQDNPEVVEARRLGIPVIPRAEMLAELMRMKRGIAVGGSHGKTTTTSLIAAVLEQGGLDPTVVVGGRLHTHGSGAKLGRGEFLVAEADESDRSFLRLQPTFAVVTNIDMEHLDAYRDLAELHDAFRGFCNRVPFYGAAIVCIDDPGARELVPRIERRTQTYGVDAPEAHVAARDLDLGASRSAYTVWVSGNEGPRIELPLPGLHNVSNSLAAIAIGIELDVSLEQIGAGLAGFAGVERRFERRGEVAGVALIDDYAHHPTEIRATLDALACSGRSGRRLVLFQPHRYTRTKALWDRFVVCFEGVDALAVTDIYAAGEAPIEGISSAALARAITEHGDPAEVFHVPGLEEAAERLAGVAVAGDTVITLGAGDVRRAGDRLLSRLEGRA